MTKSFGGGSGRKPSRPGSRGNPDRSASPNYNQGQRNQPPQVQPQPQTNVPSWAPSRGTNPTEDPAQRQYAQQNQQSAQYDEQSPQDYEQVDFRKAEASKRVVALLIDFAAAYFIGVIVAMIPFVNRFIPLQIVLVTVLLSRDYLFAGRGIGKNLMGLRVVDAASGGPPTIVQSLLRNIILMAPFVVLQTIPLLLKFSPFAWFNEAVMSLINIVGMIYVAIVLPLESYRAYSREDGLRIGDEIAGTAIVDSTMDFSNPFNR